MKQMILSLLLLGCLPMMAESPDTLFHSEKASRLLITESLQGTKVTVTDSETEKQDTILINYDSNSTVSTSQKTTRSIFEIPGKSSDRESWENDNRSSGWIMTIEGLCVGLSEAHGQTSGGGLQWSKSFEISWLSCLSFGYRFSNSRITLGLGFDWRNYKATADGRWMIPDGKGGVTWGVKPENSDVKGSQLKVFSLQLPLLFKWNPPKSYVCFKAGPILNFNTYSSIKGIYMNPEGTKCEYFTKDFKRNPVTLDFFGSISYHSYVGIYFRYSPMKVLKSSSPINFQPLTVGIGFLI